MVRVNVQRRNGENNQMTLLKKEQILAAKDSRYRDIEVPEWGGTVRIQSMSGFARDRFEASIIGNNGGTNTTNIRAKLAAATIIDENGELLFTEADIAKLGKKSCAALDRIFEAAQELNKFSDKDIEDLAKN